MATTSKVSVASVIATVALLTQSVRGTSTNDFASFGVKGGRFNIDGYDSKGKTILDLVTTSLNEPTGYDNSAGDDSVLLDNGFDNEFNRDPVLDDAEDDEEASTAYPEDTEAPSLEPSDIYVEVEEHCYFALSADISWYAQQAPEITGHSWKGTVLSVDDIPNSSQGMTISTLAGDHATDKWWANGTLGQFVHVSDTFCLRADTAYYFTTTFDEAANPLVPLGLWDTSATTDLGEFFPFKPYWWIFHDSYRSSVENYVHGLETEGALYGDIFWPFIQNQFGTPLVSCRSPFQSGPIIPSEEDANGSNGGEIIARSKRYMWNSVNTCFGSTTLRKF